MNLKNLNIVEKQNKESDIITSNLIYVFTPHFFPYKLNYPTVYIDSILGYRPDLYFDIEDHDDHSNEFQILHRLVLFHKGIYQVAQRRSNIFSLSELNKYKDYLIRKGETLDGFVPCKEFALQISIGNDTKFPIHLLPGSKIYFSGKNSDKILNKNERELESGQFFPSEENVITFYFLFPIETVLEDGLRLNLDLAFKTIYGSKKIDAVFEYDSRDGSFSGND
jgi:hypothetical protein